MELRGYWRTHRWVTHLLHPHVLFFVSWLPEVVKCFGLQCLPDPNNYHEFCRLLARLKSNYQLGELVKVENYPEVIRLIANFTVTSLQVGSECYDVCYVALLYYALLNHIILCTLIMDMERFSPHLFLSSPLVSTGSLPPTVFTTC